MSEETGKPKGSEKSAKSGASGKPRKQGKQKPKQAKPPKKEPSSGPASSTVSRTRLLRMGLIALAVVVGVIAWVATRGGDEDSEPAPEAVEAHIVTVSELADFADSAGHPVYWAGTQPDTELELSRDEEGQIFLRYLPAGAEVGSDPDALTIGTYALTDPNAAIEKISSKSGAVSSESEDGVQLITNESNPNSVYFASPDNSVQVEVYDPSPERAMSLAESGQVQPVS